MKNGFLPLIIPALSASVVFAQVDPGRQAQDNCNSLAGVSAADALTNVFVSQPRFQITDSPNPITCKEGYISIDHNLKGKYYAIGCLKNGLPKYEPNKSENSWFILAPPRNQLPDEESTPKKYRDAWKKNSSFIDTPFIVVDVHKKKYQLVYTCRVPEDLREALEDEKRQPFTPADFYKLQGAVVTDDEVRQAVKNAKQRHMQMKDQSDQIKQQYQHVPKNPNF